MRFVCGILVLTVCQMGWADLCGMPEEGRVAATTRTVSTSVESLRSVYAQKGHWEGYSASGYTERDQSETAVWNRMFDGRIPLPESPYCRYPNVRLGTGAYSSVVELRVYRLRTSDVETLDAGTLLDRWASGHLRESGTDVTHQLLGDPSDWSQEGSRTGTRSQDDDNGGLTGLLGSFKARKSEASPPAPTFHGAAGDRNHYVAVATSPPAGWRIEQDERGYFGFGWHTRSGHDAGMAAAAECRSQGGGIECSSNASGTSIRGGCVGLAIAKWRDRDEDPERTYVVTSSSFPNLIARDLRSGCDRDTFGGKYEDAVVEHSCDIVRIMCAEDVVAASITPTR